MMDGQPLSRQVLQEKYAWRGEQDLEAVQARVATALAEADGGWTATDYLVGLQAGYMPAGRILAAAGTDKATTLMNCFVLPGPGDTSSGHDEDGVPGIAETLREAMETMRLGGGVGFNFSRLRPFGALVGKTKSRASGPVSYMEMFGQMCKTVESAGARRGAMMATLRVDHPDILAFVEAKARAGDPSHPLKQFNLSVLVTDEFMELLERGEEVDLVHPVEPFDKEGAFRRADGQWVYRTVPAREIWDRIMTGTYEAAEPGVLFIDRIQAENPVGYAEAILATNPCAEAPLAGYGSCNLGSVVLPWLIVNAFHEKAHLSWEGLREAVWTGVRANDTVLDMTVWPLEEQGEEARAKRKIGLGVTGLADAMIMLGLRYDRPEGLEFAETVARVMRDEAYRASIELAKERGPFPAFDAEAHLERPFIRRLPEDIREGIRTHGLRNGTLLAIAPTGTISLAADNVSSGIEPPFAGAYERKVRQEDGSFEPFRVVDHALRMWETRNGGSAEQPPEAWVTALELTPEQHLAVLEHLAPYVDQAISKTVNCPVDISFEEFKGLYEQAHQQGLKGLTTFRPNPVTGEVLSSSDTPERPEDLATEDPDRRIRIEAPETAAMASLRWPGRPHLPEGNPAWTYMVEAPGAKFAVFVGHVENGYPDPFEVWVNGAEQPRGIGAIAKALSMDMRASDPQWLERKLESLAEVGGETFVLDGPAGETAVPSTVAAFAKVIRHRVEALGYLDREDLGSPVLDAMFAIKEPKTRPDGGMGWYADVRNPQTGDDFVMWVKELTLGGERRPFSIWLSGEYPRSLDGLAKVLSFDLRVFDPAWIGAKLRTLLDFPEAHGDFFAKDPVTGKGRSWPSTVAYMARLLVHRLAMLGILDEDGYPLAPLGVLEAPEQAADNAETTLRAAGAAENAILAGSRCGECGNYAVIKRDGCSFCTACGAQGDCG